MESKWYEAITEALDVLLNFLENLPQEIRGDAARLVPMSIMEGEASDARLADLMANGKGVASEVPAALAIRIQLLCEGVRMWQAARDVVRRTDALPPRRLGEMSRDR